MQNNQFITPLGDVSGKAFLTEYYILDYYVGDKLFSWGTNNYGILGNNAPVTVFVTPLTTFAGGTDWRSVSSGPYHAAAVKTDGTLWTWGYNNYGQLGINIASQNKSTPVTTFAGGSDWISVSCGSNFTAALKSDGTLWTWGRNINGQLGINNETDKLTPVTTFAGGNNWKQVSLGSGHSAAVKTDGTLWTWGVNSGGQLGTLETSRVTPVTTFAGGTSWKQVVCGYSNTYAIKIDGTLWVWGRNHQGQLGTGGNNSSTPVTTFAGGTGWKSVSAGSYHAAAVKTNGTLWTWGVNSNGQLGTNDTTNRSTPVTTFAGGQDWKQVSGGTGNKIAVKKDGSLWVWGDNTQECLGINLDSNFYTRALTPVTTFTGGNNWKQADVGLSAAFAVQSGTETFGGGEPAITTATGQAAYTTVGSFSWTCPAGVYDVSVVCVSGGGGGAPGNAGNGGNLAWKNAIAVTPGQSYTVVVGGGGQVGSNRIGGASYFKDNQTVWAGGGDAYGSPNQLTSIVGDGGGLGGSGYWSGGGAGGYSGNGGDASGATGSSGSGGGGGAAGQNSSYPGVAGGGVGIYGQGSNGGPGNTAGSGGSGSLYGGGGACGNGSTGGTAGTQGAVRIIWGPDNGRSFPSTNTGDM